MTEMTLKKNPSPRHTHSKHILQKNWSKTVICGLSSGQTNLQPPIWGHGHQLDDRHRNPNINIREIIWLGNQLYFGHPIFVKMLNLVPPLASNIDTFRRLSLVSCPLVSCSSDFPPLRETRLFPIPLCTTS